MKKIKSWFSKLNEPSLISQKRKILYMLSNVDTDELSFEDQLILFNMVQLEFTEMVENIKLSAIKENKLCNLYLSKDQTAKARDISVIINDPAFLKPISNLEKKY